MEMLSLVPTTAVVPIDQEEKQKQCNKMLFWCLPPACARAIGYLMSILSTLSSFGSVTTVTVRMFSVSQLAEFLDMRVFHQDTATQAVTALRSLLVVLSVLPLGQLAANFALVGGVFKEKGTCIYRCVLWYSILTAAWTHVYSLAMPVFCFLTTSDQSLNVVGVALSALAFLHTGSDVLVYSVVTLQHCKLPHFLQRSSKEEQEECL